MNRSAIGEELSRVRVDFRGLVLGADRHELASPSDGTRWTNEQLLFHMLFGYLLVRVLLPFVRFMSRRPDGVSKAFAATLDAGTRPFHVVNYVGSLGGARVLGRRRMVRVMDRVTLALARRLAAETAESLSAGMRFPVGWDPYFTEYMTVLDVYHYPTLHYGHHRRQLTIAGARDS
jgi:hypothetical protein